MRHFLSIFFAIDGSLVNDGNVPCGATCFLVDEWPLTHNDDEMSGCGRQF